MYRSTGHPELDAWLAFEIRYRQTRWSEIWLSCLMTGCGLALTLPGNTLALSPGFDLINDFLPETLIGYLALNLGFMRLVALYINGNYRRTPIFRLVGCCVGSLFWIGAGSGFYLRWIFTPSPMHMALPIFTVFVIAELHASTRAARDAVTYKSFEFRRFKRNGKPAGQSAGKDGTNGT